jgi:hypothetical protein
MNHPSPSGSPPLPRRSLTVDNNVIYGETTAGLRGYEPAVSPRLGRELPGILTRFVLLNPKSDPSPRPSPLRKRRGGIVGNSLANRGSWGVTLLLRNCRTSSSVVSAMEWGFPPEPAKNQAQTRNQLYHSRLRRMAIFDHLPIRFRGSMREIPLWGSSLSGGSPGAIKVV